MIDEALLRPWRGTDGSWELRSGAGRSHKVGLKDIAALIREMRIAGHEGEADRLRREVKWLCAWRREVLRAGPSHARAAVS